MDYEEQVINEGELTMLNLLESLKGVYCCSLPQHISDLLNDLIIALEDDIEIQSDDPRDYKEIVIIKRAYFK